jgi:hypothetical protein
MRVHESAAGTASAATSLVITMRGHLAGATHFGPTPFMKWERDESSDPDEES